MLIHLFALNISFPIVFVNFLCLSSASKVIESSTYIREWLWKCCIFDGIWIWSLSYSLALQTFLGEESNLLLPSLFFLFLSFLLSFFFFFLCGDCISSSFCSAQSDPETSMSSLGIVSFRLLIPLSGRSICRLTIFLYGWFECSSSSLIFFLSSSISCCLFSLDSSVFFFISSAFLSSSLRLWAAWYSSPFSFFRLAASSCRCVSVYDMMQCLLLVSFLFIKRL